MYSPIFVRTANYTFNKMLPVQGVRGCKIVRINCREFLTTLRVLWRVWEMNSIWSGVYRHPCTSNDYVACFISNWLFALPAIHIRFYFKSQISIFPNFSTIVFIFSIKKGFISATFLFYFIFIYQKGWQDWAVIKSYLRVYFWSVYVSHCVLNLQETSAMWRLI